MLSSITSPRFSTHKRGIKELLKRFDTLTPSERIAASSACQNINCHIEGWSSEGGLTTALIAVYNLSRRPPCARIASTWCIGLVKRALSGCDKHAACASIFSLHRLFQNASMQQETIKELAVLVLENSPPPDVKFQFLYRNRRFADAAWIDGTCRFLEARRSFARQGAEAVMMWADAVTWASALLVHLVHASPLPVDEKALRTARGLLCSTNVQLHRRGFLILYRAQDMTAGVALEDDAARCRECPICYENAHLFSTGCGHAFCRSCFLRHVHASLVGCGRTCVSCDAARCAVCPMCRASIDHADIRAAFDHLVVD